MRKISTIKGLCLVVAFVFAGFGAKAQLTNLEQSVFLNFNAPMAAFNDDLDNVLLEGTMLPLTRYNVGKSASMGVGFGYRASYRFDVGFGEVSPYVHADLQWNRTKGDVRDKYLDVDGTAPNYFNIPIFIGVNYRYQLDDIFTPFGEFGIGPDFLLITKEKGSQDYVDANNDKHSVPFEYKYTNTCNVAWQIGLGCYFGQHVSASLHYNGYGKHVVKLGGKAGAQADQDARLDGSKVDLTKTQNRSIGLLSLRIGFHF